MWNQVYDLLGSVIWSTIAAGISVVVLLCSLAFFYMQAHLTADLTLIAGVGVASFVFGTPAVVVSKAAGPGIISGLLPIGWAVLNIVFLHRLTALSGSLKVSQSSISGIIENRHL